MEAVDRDWETRWSIFDSGGYGQGRRSATLKKLLRARREVLRGRVRKSLSRL